MATATIGIHVTGADPLRVLTRRLRQEGRGDLRKRLNAAIREGGKDAVQSARDALLAQSFSSAGTSAGPKKSSSHRGGGRGQRTAARVERATTTRARELARKRDAGLRSTLARQVKLSVTQRGVKIVVPKDIIPGWANAAKDTNNEKGWRHPVFGKDVWVRERGGPWFTSTLQQQAPAFRRKLVAALNETAQQLAG